MFYKTGVDNKVVGWRTTTLWKKTPTLVFFCEFCEDFKNTYTLKNTAGDCFCIKSGLMLIHGNKKSVKNFLKFLIWFEKNLKFWDT